MNSDFSYHMCPRKEYFETLKLEERETDHLGDNKACKDYINW